MDLFTDLIVIKTNNNNKKKKKKKYDMLKLESVVSQSNSPQQSIENKEVDEKSKYIFLFEADNYHIWFEHWCILHYKASYTILKFEPLLIGVIVGTFLAVLILIYSIAGDELDVISELTIVSMFISIILVAILLIILVFAWKFGTIENKQLECIQIQRTALYNFIAHETNGDGYDKNRRHLNDIGNFLVGIQEQIAMRSVSIKIMGVTMDQIIVRLFFSTLVTSLPALYTLMGRIIGMIDQE